MILCDWALMTGALALLMGFVGYMAGREDERRRRNEV